MSNFIKKQKGITLIALVITIIVLLILAGVAISMLSGENGILQQAATAVEKDHEQADQEKIKLAMGVYEISKYESDPKTLVETLQNEDWCESAIYDDTTKTTTVKFKDCGHEYVIPDSQEEKLLYFGEPYVVRSGEFKLIFGEDGSIKSYSNGSMQFEEPAGYLKYEDGEILREGQVIGEIINEKIVIVDGIVFYHDEPTLCENPSFGEPYVGAVGEDVGVIIFGEDGSAKMYTNGIMSSEIPEGSLKYEDGIILLGDQYNGEIIDEKIIVLSGLVLHYRGEPLLCENPSHSANDGLNHWVMEEGVFECFMYSNENIPEGGEYYLSATDKYLKGNDR